MIEINKSFEKFGVKLLTILAVSLVVGVTAFLAGRLSAPQSKMAGTSGEKNPYFTNQSASLNGVIKKIEGEKLTIENASKITAVLDSSDKITINNINNMGVATSSAKRSDIKLDTQALIGLELIDGKYKVVSIVYIPSAPTPPQLEIKTPSSTANP
jgi:hypothetical protein